MVGAVAGSSEAAEGQIVLQVADDQVVDHSAAAGDAGQPLLLTALALPIIGYDTDKSAVNFVNSRPIPLALYLLSNSKRRQQQWLTRIPSGSAVVNDLIVGYLQNDQPFGGLGGSGHGAYHGREGFDAMSHLRPVMYQRHIFGRTGVQMLYPPYDNIIADVLLKLMRRI